MKGFRPTSVPKPQPEPLWIFVNPPSRNENPDALDDLSSDSDDEYFDVVQLPGLRPPQPSSPHAPSTSPLPDQQQAKPLEGNATQELTHIPPAHSQSMPAVNKGLASSKMGNVQPGSPTADTATDSKKPVYTAQQVPYKRKAETTDLASAINVLASPSSSKSKLENSFSGDNKLKVDNAHKNDFKFDKEPATARQSLVNNKNVIDSPCTCKDETIKPPNTSKIENSLKTVDKTKEGGVNAGNVANSDIRISKVTEPTNCNDSDSRNILGMTDISKTGMKSESESSPKLHSKISKKDEAQSNLELGATKKDEKEKHHISSKEENKPKGDFEVKSNMQNVQKIGANVAPAPDITRKEISKEKTIIGEKEGVSKVKNISNAASTPKDSLGSSSENEMKHTDNHSLAKDINKPNDAVELDTKKKLENIANVDTQKFKSGELDVVGKENDLPKSSDQHENPGKLTSLNKKSTIMTGKETEPKGTNLPKSDSLGMPPSPPLQNKQELSVKPKVKSSVPVNKAVTSDSIKVEESLNIHKYSKPSNKSEKVETKTEKLEKNAAPKEISEKSTLDLIDKFDDSKKSASVVGKHDNKSNSDKEGSKQSISLDESHNTVNRMVPVASGNDNKKPTSDDGTSRKSDIKSSDTTESTDLVKKPSEASISKCSMKTSSSDAKVSNEAIKKPISDDSLPKDLDTKPVSKDAVKILSSDDTVSKDAIKKQLSDASASKDAVKKPSSDDIVSKDSVKNPSSDDTVSKGAVKKPSSNSIKSKDAVENSSLGSPVSENLDSKPSSNASVPKDSNKTPTLDAEVAKDSINKQSKDIPLSKNATNNPSSDAPTSKDASIKPSSDTLGSGNSSKIVPKDQKESSGSPVCVKKPNTEIKVKAPDAIEKLKVKANSDLTPPEKPVSSPGVAGKDPAPVPDSVARIGEISSKTEGGCHPVVSSKEIPTKKKMDLTNSKEEGEKNSSKKATLNGDVAICDDIVNSKILNGVCDNDDDDDDNDISEMETFVDLSRCSSVASNTSRTLSPDGSQRIKIRKPQGEKLSAMKNLWESEDLSQSSEKSPLKRPSNKPKVGKISGIKNLFESGKVVEKPELQNNPNLVKLRSASNAAIIEPKAALNQQKKSVSGAAGIAAMNAAKFGGTSKFKKPSECPPEAGDKILKKEKPIKSKSVAQIDDNLKENDSVAEQNNLKAPEAKESETKAVPNSGDTAVNLENQKNINSAVSLDSIKDKAQKEEKCLENKKASADEKCLENKIPNEKPTTDDKDLDIKKTQVEDKSKENKNTPVEDKCKENKKTSVEDKCKENKNTPVENNVNENKKTPVDAKSLETISNADAKEKSLIKEVKEEKLEKNKETESVEKNGNVQLSELPETKVPDIKNIKNNKDVPSIIKESEIKAKIAVESSDSAETSLPSGKMKSLIKRKKKKKEKDSEVSDENKKNQGESSDVKMETVNDIVDSKLTDGMKTIFNKSDKSKRDSYSDDSDTKDSTKESAKTDIGKNEIGKDVTIDQENGEQNNEINNSESKFKGNKTLGGIKSFIIESVAKGGKSLEDKLSKTGIPLGKKSAKTYNQKDSPLFESRSKKKVSPIDLKISANESPLTNSPNVQLVEDMSKSKQNYKQSVLDDVTALESEVEALIKEASELPPPKKSYRSTQRSYPKLTLPLKPSLHSVASFPDTPMGSELCIASLPASPTDEKKSFDFGDKLKIFSLPASPTKEVHFNFEETSEEEEVFVDAIDPGQLDTLMPLPDVQSERDIRSRSRTPMDFRERSVTPSPVIAESEAILSETDRLLRRSRSNKSLRRSYSRSLSSAALNKLSEVTADLSEEHTTAHLAGERLEAEQAERMKLEKEIDRLQTDVKRMTSANGKLEMEKLALRSEVLSAAELNGDVDDDEAADASLYKRKYEWCLREIELLKKQSKQQQEDDLDQLLLLKKQLEKKVADAYEETDEQRQVVAQLKRKCQRLQAEMNDLKILLEEQTSRNNLLEKKQRKFDQEVMSVQEELRHERTNKDKIQRERDQILSEKYSFEQEVTTLKLELELKEEKVAALNRELDDLTSSGKGEEEVATLKKAKHDLELRIKDQEEELDDLAGQVQMLEGAKVRLEMSMEQMRKENRREISQREEELEEIRLSAQKKVKSLEAQLENEHEERTLLVREKHELERRITDLQDRTITHVDEDYVHKLKKELKKTKALLRDTQTMLEKAQSEGSHKLMLRQLRTQLEDAEFAKTAALKARQCAESDLSDVSSQLDEALRAKKESEDKCARVNKERAEIQTQLEESEEEVAEVMKKYKAVVSQLSVDQITLSEQSQQIAELEHSKQVLQERMLELSSKVEVLEGETANIHTQRRLEMKIKEIESKLELELTTRQRLESQISRLKDQIERLSGECDAAKMKESQALDQCKRFTRQLRDAKEDLSNVQQRYTEAANKKSELEKQLELSDSEVITLKSDLKLAFKRIEDLQQAIQGDLSDSDSELSDSDSDSDGSLSSYLTASLKQQRSSSNSTLRTPPSEVQQLERLEIPHSPCSEAMSAISEDLDDTSNKESFA